VPRTRDDHRRRKRQDALGELESRAHHRRRLRSARAQHAEVEPGGEDAVPAGEHHDRTIRLGAVERCVHLRQHPERHRVHLAVVHRNGRDGVFEPVVDDARHRSVSFGFQDSVS
jgi:hypothetical protein